MLVSSTIVKDGINDVAAGLNSSINYLEHKGKTLFEKNPIACVSIAFLLGVGAAALVYSSVSSDEN